ncbi:MAG TPA: hypothetical protein VFR86_26780, partial [Burkholderiaceae bacterium]|nr:hypothetical protein [Burkholderiaceae bacterium]
MNRRWTWLWRGVLAGTIVIALAAIVLVLLAATSGVLATRADDWRIRVPLLKYRTQELALPINVAGATRLALSPLGRRLLDGRAFTTRFGHVQFARRERALVIRCAPCRVNDARVASQTVSLQALELRLTPRTDALDLAPLDGVLIGGGARVNFVADLRRSGVTLEWDLPSTEIAQLVRLLADAVPEARRAQIGGTVQARGRVKLPAKQARTELRIADFSVEGLGTESLRYGSFDHLCAGASAFRTSGEGTTDWIGLDALGRWLPA